MRLCSRSLLALVALGFGLLDPAAAQTRLQTLTACCGFGWAVADLADIDGDHRTDLVVGANESGQAYVYSGRSRQLLFTLSQPNSDNGSAVADAGDVDGDGLHDIVTGAPGSGQVSLWSGRDGHLLRRIDAPVAGSQFGFAVSSAGDLDHDGHADLWVGAPVGAGAAYLISGASGAVLRTLSETAGTRYGSGLSRLVDLDDDGVPDVAVAAPSQGVGRVTVYSGASGTRLFNLDSDAGGSEFGTFFVADAGDVDADGRHDIYVGDPNATGGNGAAYVFSGRDGHRLIRFAGSSREGAGCGRGAGDVDGDGHADLIVGSYTYSGAGLREGGRVSLISGATGQVMQTVNGRTAGGQFGYDAVGLGDLDGDGRLDFVVAGQPANQVDLYAGSIARNSQRPIAIDAGSTGAWYNPATVGQGFLADVRGNNPFLFVAWFTYATATPTAAKVGSPEQRWLTLQGSYSGTVAELPIFLTSGGAFDTPRGTSTRAVGSATFEQTSCTEAQITYSLPEEQLHGRIPLVRLISPSSGSCAPATP